jgi:hypothetical protein
MLDVALRCALAAVLLVAAGAKAARPGESRAALGGLVPWLPLPVLVGIELALAGTVAAGFDGAALAASVFMLGAAAVLGRALMDGRAGAPCGCFGARSRVSRLGVFRALALSAAFLALPFVPSVAPSTDAWLAAGLGVALVAILALGVAVLALAREVGMLRLAVGPQAALEIPEEGPALGVDTGLAAHLDPRADASVIGLAVFSSEGCALCRRLGPQIRALGRDPHVDLLELDEVRDAGHWRRLDIPGSPFAVALDTTGHVLAKGTFNTVAQLESVLATAERRRAEHTGV